MADTVRELRLDSSFHGPLSILRDQQPNGSQNMWARFVGLVIATIAVVLMCPAAWGATNTRSIRLVGDSITAESTHELTAYFTWAAYKSIAIHAVPGSDTWARQWDVYADAKLAPTIEVINLGTNDANHIGVSTAYEPAQTMSDVLHRLRVFASRALFPRSCVVFVTVNSHTTSWNPINAAVINAQIRAFAHAADWDAAWSASYFDGVETPPDNVHPNELGRHVLVHLIADTIKQSCQATT
jgi:hypothetical protein